ncbi:MAG: AAA family ATPase [Saprospiraceae bacterium]
MSAEKEIQQQEPEKPNQSYISRVRLKGYKSIIDTEVTFKPGLNIIIGANGSGKTNFVEFLGTILKSQYLDKEYQASIAFYYAEQQGLYEIERRFFRDRRRKRIILGYKEKYIFNKEIEFDTPISRSSNDLLVYDEWTALTPIIIPFSISKDFQNLHSLVKFSITEIIIIDDLNNDNIIGRIYNSQTEPTSTEGINKLLEEIFLPAIKNNNRNKYENIYSLPHDFINIIKKFTPIQDIKFSPNYKVNIEEGGVEVQYLRFEFLVNGDWITWNDLSDGSKRIFYIITEVTFSNNVILLEEPELGIHPDQLRKLMSFLREQAEEKQIIITTHSPQVLNALAADELDRIIIARYEKEAGTKLYHLTEEEMAHARSYMETEGLFLSDYWVYSGFEKEEEAV